jgi:3-dehydroquinate dehydratase-2
MNFKRRGNKRWSIGLLHARSRRSPWWQNNATTTELFKSVIEFGEDLGVSIECYVSEYEPELVDFVYKRLDGYLVNPATFTAYGENLRSALIDVNKPFIEVHALNLSKWFAQRPPRAAATMESNFTHPAVGIVAGFGLYSYFGALLSLVMVLDDPNFLGQQTTTN